jgi:hypothetical protein
MNASAGAQGLARAILFIVLLAPALVFSQVSYDAAALKGTIFDSAEMRIQSAVITLTNTATGVTRTASSGNDGSYRIPAIPPGDYKMTIEKEGFDKSVVDSLILTVGAAVTYDVHLKVGTVKQIVEVTDRQFLIDTEQTQQANTVNRAQVENLPNIARLFTDLIYTVPGVNDSNAASIQDPDVGTGYLSSGFSIGGSNGRNNLITIDGGENDYGSGAPRVRNVPLDSIQEFQVNRSSFAAEFGNTVGTAINFITKSGTNTFHGSASAYFHDENLDSVNYFNRLIAPGSKPFEQSFIPSATFGGPIQRDKLLFFTAYEHQRLDSATSQDYSGTTEFQPVSAQTNGYGGGKCPGAPEQVTQLCYLTQLANLGGPLAPVGAEFLASPIFGAPLADPILNALVQPNQGTFDGIISSLALVRGVPGYTTPRGRYSNWVSRADYLPGTGNNIMVRFSLMNEGDSVVPQPPSSTFDHRSDYTITTAWTHTFSPSLVNVLRVQAVPSNTLTIRAPQKGGSEIDLVAGSSIVLGTPFSVPYTALIKRFQFDDGLYLQEGTHTFKFGFSYRPDSYSINEQLWFGGQWQFVEGAIPLIALLPPSDQSALAAYNVSQGYPAEGPSSTNLTAAQSFIAGTPIALLQSNPNSNTLWTSWDQSLGLYGQDAWKVSSRLTLNYGLRLDFDAPPPPIPHSTRVSPRAGIAWNPDARGKTVIRAGGGLFVAPVLFTVPFYLNAIGTSGRYIDQGALSAGLPSPPFPSIFAAWATAASHATVNDPNPALSPADMASIGWSITPPGPTSFGSIFSTLAPHFKPEYSIQLSFSVARQLGRNQSVEVGYDRYRSLNIEQVDEGNYQSAPCNSVNPAMYTAVIDPFVGPCYVPKPGTTAGEPNSVVFQNDVYGSVANGIYNGLTISFDRRFARGLQFQANYTLSRAKDDTSDFSSLSVPFRPDQLSRDWSISDFDVTNNFVANAVYITPFKSGGKGWARLFSNVVLSPMLRAHSGIPFTALVPGLGGVAGNGTIGHTSEARPWNEPRNLGRGGNFFSFDARGSKAIYFEKKTGVQLDFIAEAQNILNRTNFAAVNNIFPANPAYALPNGGNLLSGPYNVRGFAPKSVSQLSQPLAFTSAYPPRYVSVGLKLAF